MSRIQVVTSFFKPPFKIIGSHFGRAVLILWAASTLIWALAPLGPGDPALYWLQGQGIYSPGPAELESARLSLGLDRSLPVQYGQWLGRTLQGDFSDSYQSGQPVLSEFGRRLPATLLLIGAALVISLLVALPTGLLGAVYQAHWPDQMVRFLGQIGLQIPLFLVGLALLDAMVVLEPEPGWSKILLSGQPDQMWLPAVCLALGVSANWAQEVRTRLLAALGNYTTLLARSRAAVRLRVLLRYALPQVWLPLLTTIGVGMGYWLGGVPIIERVFNWPGIGCYVVEAIGARDLPVIQGALLIGALVYVGLDLSVKLIELVETSLSEVTLP